MEMADDVLVPILTMKKLSTFESKFWLFLTSFGFFEVNPLVPLLYYLLIVVMIYLY